MFGLLLIEVFLIGLGTLFLWAVVRNFDVALESSAMSGIGAALFSILPCLYPGMLFCDDCSPFQAAMMLFLVAFTAGLLWFAWEEAPWRQHAI